MSEYIVAFIDILGTKDQVLNAKSKDDFDDAMYKINFFKKSFFDQLPERPEETLSKVQIQMFGFSDCIIIAHELPAEFNSSEPDKGGDAFDDINLFLGALCHAQLDCILEHGIFIRGGIEVGQWMINNDERTGLTIVSQAQCKAYEIESHKEKAINPIIGFGDNILKLYKTMPGQAVYTNEENPVDKYLSNYKSNIYFLNYLSLLSYYDYPYNEVTGHIQRINDVLKTISPKATSVRSKYEWLKDYHHDFCTKAGLADTV